VATWRQTIYTVNPQADQVLSLIIFHSISLQVFFLTKSFSDVELPVPLQPQEGDPGFTSHRRLSSQHCSGLYFEKQYIFKQLGDAFLPHNHFTPDWRMVRVY
jgi:hypothetical protein